MTEFKRKNEKLQTSDDNKIIGKDLKEFLTNDYLKVSVEGHMYAWFDKKYKGESQKHIKATLMQHDDSLEIESAEEALNRSLNEKEINFLVENFHNMIIKRIKFGGATGWYDTCDELNKR